MEPLSYALPESWKGLTKLNGAVSWQCVRCRGRVNARLPCRRRHSLGAAGSEPMSIVAPFELGETESGSRAAATHRVSLTAFTAVIVLAAVFRLWRLDQNGLGNIYYAAAVRSMLMSWNNFLFAAFDPGGYVSVDKPPVALWVQTAFAFMFGYRGVSLLLPQAMAGIATVAVLTSIVWRSSGAIAGLLAGVVLAVSPISVAVDRENLPDSLLVLALVLGAWALLKATRGGGLRWLLLCCVFVGVGFNIKMMAAYVILPTFYLVYLMSAKASPGSRLAHLSAATIVLAAVSLSWAALVDLTPQDQRPYMGGSTNNSALNLAVGYNGLGRVFGGSGNFAGPPGMGLGGPGMRGPGGGLPPMPPGGQTPRGFPPMGGGPAMPGMSMGLIPFGGPPGPFRFLFPAIAGQITWLFPLAFFGSCSAALRMRPWRPLGEDAQPLLLWTGWLVTHLAVFSFSRGIMHPYYVTVMAPAVAGLVGPGVIALAADYRSGTRRFGLLTISLVATALWQVVIVGVLGGSWRPWLIPLIVIGLATAVLALSRLKRRETDDDPPDLRLSKHRLIQAVMVGGVIAVLAAPVAWSLTPVLGKGSGLFPAADPALLSGGGISELPGMAVEGTHKLVAFLQANRHGERFLLATPNAPSAAPVIIETGEPVMAVGGFIGADPILTPEGFAAKVATGEVRFVMVMVFEGPREQGSPPTPDMGGGPPGMRSEVMNWVKEHGTPVESELWKAETLETVTPAVFPPRGPFGPGGMKLYDCRPELGLVDAFDGSRAKGPERSQP